MNDRYLPLTQSQLLLWAGQKLNPKSPLHNTAHSFDIAGSIDEDLFKKAFKELIKRVDALRIVFSENEGIPSQSVRSHMDFEVEVVDFTSESDEDTIQNWLFHRSQQGLDLTSRVFDAALLRVNSSRYIWFLNMHHLVTDAVSATLVYKNLCLLYGHLLGDTLTEAEAIPSFIDYISYENAQSGSDESKVNHDYWTNKIAGYNKLHSLYGEGALADTTDSVRISINLGLERSRYLRDLAVKPKIRGWSKDLTLFNLLATAFFTYIYRVSGQKKLIVGAPANNRVTNNYKKTVGLFIEIFPLVAELTDEDTFYDVLERLKLETNDYLRHVKPGMVTPEISRGFNVIFNFINVSFSDFNGMPMRSEWIHTNHMDVAHQMRCHVYDFDATGDLEIHLDLNKGMFGATMLEKIPSHLLGLIDAMLADINQPILKKGLTTEAEEKRFFAPKLKPSTDFTSILKSFEANVQNSPNAVALRYKSETLTYKGLNKIANQLAHHLLRQGVGPDGKIAIYSYRNLEYIVSVLAVMKSGGAFIPIASNQPAERVDFIIKNADCSLILTDTELKTNLRSTEIPIIEVSSVKEIISSEPSDNPGIEPLENGLAYVLYTSGSTGNPKGVLISNKALSNYIFWGKSYYGFTSGSSFALFTSIGFDLTITSTFIPLVSGGRIIIYRESESGPDASVLDVLKDNLVDTIKLTPSHLSLLKDKDLSGSNIRKIIVGGEDFKVNLGKTITEAFDNRVKIYNEYGPTEATVGCIVSEFNPGKHTGSSIPIGKLVSNMHAYILDGHKNIVPSGVVGELYLSGHSLSDGYLGLDALTNQKFIENPFVEGLKMYHTGDLARINQDGEYEYLGRVDEQVKLRGYRIELTDIEANLTDFDGVDECAVVLVENKKEHVEEADVINCTVCGLPSNYPQTDFDEHGVCNLCNAFEGYKEKAERYFKTEQELKEILMSTKGKNPKYDCLSLLSGGKDSTYILAQLVNMGMKVLAFTLDNGYISDQAKANINRIVEKLGVDHVYGQTEHMNAIFVDSLNRHQNVCNGCFKTIYTLSTKIAMDNKIPFIVTGLSRGQFFETRLTEELFWEDDLDVKKIDDAILEVRKLYHQEEDAVKDLLDVSIFETDEVFDRVQFLDFYRYSDVSLEDMLKFLKEKVGWVRPTDTGRSTNCLINQLGIYVHKKELGYSNYSFPYSWDVRLGHKTRDESLEEINEYIDEPEVKRIMKEIGYEEPDVFEADEKLVAYYTGNNGLTQSELKQYLSEKVPFYMVPSMFKHLEEMPLTKNGKTDKKTLRSLTLDQLEMEVSFVAPRNDIEVLVEGVWKEVLRLDKIGVHDNFIALGGHSLAAIRVTSRINDELDMDIPLNKVFNLPTIEAYANYIEETITVILDQ